MAGLGRPGSERFSLEWLAAEAGVSAGYGGTDVAAGMRSSCVSVCDSRMIEDTVTRFTVAHCSHALIQDSCWSGCFAGMFRQSATGGGHRSCEVYRCGSPLAGDCSRAIERIWVNILVCRKHAEGACRLRRLAGDCGGRVSRARSAGADLRDGAAGLGSSWDKAGDKGGGRGTRGLCGVRPWGWP